MQVIITSPSLDTSLNVSGISAITKLIIECNDRVEYIHFELGKRDTESGGLRRIPAILRRLSQWMQLLRDYPKAIIHYNFPLSAPSILRDPCFMFLARKAGKRILIHVHGGQYLTSAKIPFVLNCILRWVFTTNCPVVVLSREEKDILTERFGCQDIRVIPNCVKCEELAPKAPHDIIQMGYLGRIAKTKGMQELLDACAELKARGFLYHLNIAGAEENAGEFIPRFKDNLGDSFTYWGTVSGETKAAFLRKTDIFVLPSYFEGLPMCLLESMSYGCVPMTTNVGSVPSLVVNGENGVFITPKDADSIVENTLALSKNPALLRKMAETAVLTIKKSYSVDRYVANLNLLYDTLHVI